MLTGQVVTRPLDWGWITRCIKLEIMFHWTQGPLCKCEPATSIRISSKVSQLEWSEVHRSWSGSEWSELSDQGPIVLSIYQSKGQNYQSQGLNTRVTIHQRPDDQILDRNLHWSEPDEPNRWRQLLIDHSGVPRFLDGAPEHRWCENNPTAKFATTLLNFLFQPLKNHLMWFVFGLELLSYLCTVLSWKTAH